MNPMNPKPFPQKTSQKSKDYRNEKWEEVKNGLYKFIHHETSMLIPLANAIFDNTIDINDFIKPKLNSKKSIFFQPQ